ncbi:MAG: autotransporter domain-containing protein, partial [Alphaproteobacteria bacterium]|nr:autotransporter domain-containing protein [Alphaproteobacteria bacterium]MDX5416759.1 autotransporter domain-containing protein [Alphaproteobacteria bacterium]MDX5494143.1 autotransporter domain-containing protein [Alphaproteobacteria bacterium]
GGTLQIGNGGTAGSVAGDIANDGTLIIDRSDAYTYAGDLSGAGDIRLLGAGATRLTGYNSGFTGSFFVEAGMLIVDDIIGGTLNVTGARLGGGGNLENLTIGNGGVLAPGNSVGAMIAYGDAAFGDGALFEVEVNDGTSLAFVDRPGVNNDFLDVRGSLTIDSGAAVHVTPENGTDDGSTYTPGLIYTILTASGGVTGAFGNVTTDFAFLAPELTYGPNDVFLELVHNNADFSEVAVTPNQQGVSNTVQQFGPGHPLYDEIIMMTDEEARAAYDALSGESHSSASTTQFMTAAEIRQQLLNRISALFGSGGGGLAGLAGAPAAGEAAPGTASIWGQLFGGWGESDAHAAAAAVDRRIHGFIGGADREIAPGISAGLALGYSRTSYSVAARASSGDSDNFHIAGYAGTELGDVDLRGILSYGYGRSDTQRTAVVGGVVNNLSASYGTHTFQAAVEAAVGFDAGPVTLTPFAGLAGVHVETESFTETGGPAALSFASSGNTTGISTLGLRVGREAGQVALTGAAAWRHAFGDVEPASRAAFASAPASTFAVRGAPVSEDALVLDAGVTARLDTSTTLTIGYSGEYASGARDHGLRAELRIEF